MISVLGDRVLVAVQPPPDEVVSESGIVLMKDPDRFKTPTRGIVMALGTKTATVAITDVIDMVIAIREQATREQSGRLDGECCSNTCEALLSDLQHLKPAAFDVQLGDFVLFGATAGDCVEADGVEYVILREDEIIGIVEPKAEAA